jgi:hypothetical protein
VTLHTACPIFYHLRPPVQTCHPKTPHVNISQELHISLLWLFAEDRAHSDTDELQLVRAQLVHKSQLLSKVKTLLQRAAAKEKMLQDKVRPQHHSEEEPTISPGIPD